MPSLKKVVINVVFLSKDILRQLRVAREIHCALLHFRGVGPTRTKVNVVGSGVPYSKIVYTIFDLTSPRPRLESGTHFFLSDRMTLLSLESGSGSVSVSLYSRRVRKTLVVVFHSWKAF